MKNMIKIAAAALMLAGIARIAQAEELKFAAFTPPQHTVTASLVVKLGASI